MDSPLPDVLEPVGNAAIDHRLRGQGDLAALQRGFKQVSHFEADLRPKRSGQGDLIFVFDPYEWHCGGSMQVRKSESQNRSNRIE
jgi:hypothetical protein